MPEEKFQQLSHHGNEKIIAAFLISVCLYSCSKENSNTDIDSTKVQLTIGAKSDLSSKTVLDGSDPEHLVANWLGNEAIGVVATKDNSFTDQTFTVKFDMKGHGEAIQDAKVAWNQKATAPSTPTAANYAFWCWCTDEECTTPYDFSKPVTSDLTLYAKWTNGINGHSYIELAGYKWATENVGFCNSVTAIAGPDKPNNGWGLYYYWQEVNSALNAAQSWGSEGNHTWTLPSREQWDDLIGQCYWEWTDSFNYPTSPYYGKSGFIVYKAESDDDKNQFNKENSGYTPSADTHLFLPAAGIYNFSNGRIFGQGNGGYYWSTYSKGYLFFNNENRIMDLTGNTSDGFAVRPVSE